MVAQRWFRAKDTFVAGLADGSEVFVAKGDTKPESHELVQRDLAGAGVLFAPLDEDKPAAKPRGAKAGS